MGLADRDYVRADAADAAGAAQAAATASRLARYGGLLLLAVAVWQLAAGRWHVAAIALAAVAVLLTVRLLPRGRRRSPAPPLPDASLDALLARVSEVGLEGLTDAERAALSQASAALRARRGY
jgi:hypothetical protein